MDCEYFDAIKARAEGFSHSAFTYTEYEDVSDYRVVSDSPDLAAIAGFKAGGGAVIELIWAANDPCTVISAANGMNGAVIAGFIPDEWYTLFIQSGFKEYGVLRDYWLSPLPVTEPDGCKPIAYEEAAAAADVTVQCAGQSREFCGETAEWMREWLGGTEPNAVASGDSGDFAVLGAYVEGELAGVACVCVYSRESEKGPILWLRELAVSPRFQHQGIGRRLVHAAIAHGRAHGATRSFLMADELNKNAVKLYLDAGYIPGSETQTDLIYEP